MHESMISKLSFASLAAIITGIGFLIRRRIERRGDRDVLERNERLLRLRKELQDQNITHEQLQEFADKFFSKGVATRPSMSGHGLDRHRKILVLILNIMVIAIAIYTLRSFLKESSTVSRSDVFFISYWTTILCYGLFSLMQLFNEWLALRININAT